MPALPSVRQLRYFVSLAEHLHFRKAAEATYVTQPTLSAGIKELESTLGVSLFERDKTKVRLTAAGEAVLARARSLVAAAQDLVEVAHGLSDPLTGVFRLGVIPTIAPFMLPGVIGDLRTVYPKLELHLREDLTARLLESLEAGGIDAALVALPYPVGDLLVREIQRDEFWLVAPEGHPALKDERVGVDRIPVDELLLLEEGHCLRDQALQACGDRAASSRRGIAATSLVTLIQMVEGGLGVTLLPEMAIKSGLLKNTKLLARPFAGKPPARIIAIATRAATARRRDVDLLAEYFLERAREQGIARPGGVASLPALRKAAK